MNEIISLLFQLNELHGPVSLVPHKWPCYPGRLTVVSRSGGTTQIIISADDADGLYHAMREKVAQYARERAQEWARLQAERDRAERFGFDEETCRANAAECGGL